jgi:hypothetical protein
VHESHGIGPFHDPPGAIVHSPPDLEPWPDPSERSKYQAKSLLVRALIIEHPHGRVWGRESLSDQIGRNICWLVGRVVKRVY